MNTHSVARQTRAPAGPGALLPDDLAAGRVERPHDTRLLANDIELAAAARRLAGRHHHRRLAKVEVRALHRGAVVVDVGVVAEARGVPVVVVAVSAVAAGDGACGFARRRRRKAYRWHGRGGVRARKRAARITHATTPRRSHKTQTADAPRVWAVDGRLPPERARVEVERDDGVVRVALAARELQARGLLGGVVRAQVAEREEAVVDLLGHAVVFVCLLRPVQRGVFEVRVGRLAAGRQRRGVRERERVRAEKACTPSASPFLPPPANATRRPPPPARSLVVVARRDDDLVAHAVDQRRRPPHGGARPAAGLAPVVGRRVVAPADDARRGVDRDDAAAEGAALVRLACMRLLFCVVLRGCCVVFSGSSGRAAGCWLDLHAASMEPKHHKNRGEGGGARRIQRPAAAAGGGGKRRQRQARGGGLAAHGSRRSPRGSRRRRRASRGRAPGSSSRRRRCWGRPACPSAGCRCGGRGRGSTRSRRRSAVCVYVCLVRVECMCAGVCAGVCCGSARAVEPHCEQKY